MTKKGFILNGEIVCTQCAKNRNFDESGLKEYDIILSSDEIKSYCEICAQILVERR